MGGKMKVVINACYGGFEISDKAFEWLIKEKGWIVTNYTKEGYYENPDAQIVDTKSLPNSDSFTFRYSFVEDDRLLRTNFNIIEAVETLGKEVNSDGSRLKIIEIPPEVEWQIEEYNGWEYIAEKHRTWE